MRGSASLTTTAYWGTFELGELPTAVLDDGRQIHLRAIAVEDGANLLAHDVVWDGEDGGVGDTRRCSSTPSTSTL